MPNNTDSPAGLPCAACGADRQPMTATRYQPPGQIGWCELWRCSDIAACHDRMFPQLAALAGRTPGASYVRPDRSAYLAPADTMTALGALSDAVRWQEMRQSRCRACQSNLTCGQHADCGRLIAAM